jgi:Tol biopolymer transport system component
MRSLPLRRAGLLAGAALLTPLATPASLVAQTVPTRLPAAAADPLARADVAWDRGDYPSALRGYQALVAGPDAERVRRAVALTTGELYRTTELTTDGRLARLSPRGSLVAWERGTGAQRATVVRALGAGYAAPVAELSGHGVSFSADDGRLSYLRTPPAGASANDAPVLVVRDVRGGQERTRALPGLRPAGAPVLAADGRTAYLLASSGADSSVTLYAVTDGGEPRAITQSTTVKGDLALLPDGKTLLYTEGRRTRLSPPPAFVLHDGRAERRVAGFAPSASAGGSALVYLARAGDTTRVQVLPLAGGAPTTAAATTDRVDAPAISPDGRTVAYQRMLEDDWELFVAGADGAGERRLTREIQHDLMPRFLTNGRLLAVMGEARHRRSYLYDVATGERTRLFHNNTVRTIAPEYEWAATPDGGTVVIVAERDGDTISPERGVYVTDLAREVTAAELAERLRLMGEAEGALRTLGAAMFRPIADSVRAAVAEVSMTALYGFQKRLSEFDSRYVGRPGNTAAGEYLAAAFRAMGYEPEMQWFEPMGLARTANVLATLPGTTHPELVYVVSAHYDSHQNGPGADDDASGTAMILEMARVLRGRPLPATVVFAAFTGEEAGLLGSREFVRRAVADSVRIVGALNNDMFGWSNDHRLDNTIRYSNPGIRDIQHAGAFLYSDLVTYDALYYKNTDAHAYYEAYGDIVGGVGSYPVLGNPHYHQSHDLLETINHEQVRETTKATLAALMLMASSPARLGDVAAASGAGGLEVTWAPAAERDVAGYRVRYVAADGRERTVEVTEPRARLTDVRAGAPMRVRVKAVNRRGLEGWDWAWVR